MDDHDSKCWLCGRDIERPGVEATQFGGIPIHRECLEEDYRGLHGMPLAAPDDVIYLSAALFRT